MQSRQMAAYFFPIYKEGKSYVFHLYNAELKAYEWKGANKYPSLMEAWEAFKIFLELLKIWLVVIIRKTVHHPAFTA